MAGTAVHIVALAEGVRGLAEGGVDIAVGEMLARGNVVGMAQVGARRAGLQRRLTVGDGVQGLPVDDHPIRPVLRRVAAVGDDHGNGLADEADLVGRQRPLRHRIGDGGARHLQQDALAAHHGRQVISGIDRYHAGHGARAGHVDGADTGMGEGAAHEGAFHHARQPEVVHEAALAGQQVGVFQALDALPDEDAPGHAAPPLTTDMAARTMVS